MKLSKNLLYLGWVFILISFQGLSQITGTNLNNCSGSGQFVNTNAACGTNGATLGNPNSGGQVSVTITNLSLPSCPNNQNACTGNSAPYIRICNGGTCINITANGTYTNVNWTNEVTICLVNCCPNETSTFNFSWDTQSGGSSVCCSNNSECPDGECIAGACILPPVCATCNTACGTCGFETNPTVQQVVDNCPSYPFTPALASGQSATRCHQFTAVNTTVSFNVIISSNCSGGNVSAFSWTLQSSTCGGILQSGTLTNLSFTGLTIGETYTFCYTFTVPSPAGGCSHSTHYPYFVGAETVVLPIELSYFRVENQQEANRVSWGTKTEKDNSYFSIDHSTDGYSWNLMHIEPGAGNSSSQLNYQTLHRNFISGINYYRLSQTDFDGKSEVFNIISINNSASMELIRTLNIYGQEVNKNYRGIVIEYYYDGSTVKVMR